MDAPDYGKQVNFADGPDYGKQVNFAGGRDCGKQVNFVDGQGFVKHHMYRHTQIACSGQQM